MIEEARLEPVGNGLAPVTEGWFVVNARDAAWIRHDTFGQRCPFEPNGPVVRGTEVEPLHFDQLGIGLSVLQPGQPSTLYTVGARNAREWLYSPTPLAESVEQETTSGSDAYAPYGHWRNEGSCPL